MLDQVRNQNVGFLRTRLIYDFLQPLGLSITEEDKFRSMHVWHTKIGMVMFNLKTKDVFALKFYTSLTCTFNGQKKLIVLNLSILHKISTYQNLITDNI